LSQDEWLTVIFGRFYSHRHPQITAAMRPYAMLVFGILMLSWAVIGTCTGKAGYRNVIRRIEEPKKFFWDIVSQYLIGICCIGYFLYETYWLPK